MRNIKTSTEFRAVSIGEAGRFLESNTFDGQRAIRQHHVKRLAMLMQRGEFIPGTPIHFARYQGKRILVNGQHTLSAIRESGRPQMLTIVWHHCQSEKDIAFLYSTFDRHLLRTNADAMLGFDAAANFKLTKTELRVASSAITMLATGFSPQSAQETYIRNALRSPHLVYALLEDWQPEMSAFFGDLDDTTNAILHRLQRQSVASVALVTYRYAPELASSFWHGVAMDDGLGAKDPRKALLNFLANNDLKKFDRRHYARFVATAWNAFYKSTTLVLLRVRDPLAPIHIEGTLHTRKQTMCYLNHGGDVLHEPQPIDEAIGN